MSESTVSEQPLLSVQGLKVYFEQDGVTVYAVNDFTISIDRGEVVCIIGESGSGKSTAGLALLGMHQGRPGIVGGVMRFRGNDLLEGLDAYCRVEQNGQDVSVKKRERPWNREFKRRTHELRGREISFVFQDAQSSLTPFLTVGAQLMEVIKRNRREPLKKQERKSRAIEWLARVGMPSPEEALSLYPFQLSGGLCRRATLAIALAGNPSLIVADEPTEALDTATQMGVMMLLNRLRKNGGPGILLITHHIQTAVTLADRIAVMYAGRVVERAEKEWFFEDDNHQHHPYTEVFLASIAKGGDAVDEFEAFFEGPTVNARHLPTGCPFHPKCLYAKDMPDGGEQCRSEDPPEFVVADSEPGTQIRCWRYDPKGSDRG